MCKAIVIYHANCNDGFGAAWAFHCLKEHQYESVDYIPMKYGQTPDWNRLEKVDEDCFILDFSFDRETLRQISYLFQRTVVLDHHKTAKESLENWKNKPANIEIVFDMNRSGAGITWDYFASEAKVDRWQVGNTHRPILINYIEDRDLWKFKLEFSKEVHAFLSIQPQTFKAYSEINDLVTQNISKVQEIGCYLRMQIDRLNESFVSLARPCTIESYRDGIQELNQGLVVNCPGQFASDVGNLLALKSRTFGASYYTDENGDTKWSLRSVGDYDVSRIAKAYGGGGHKNAAGFVIPANSEHGHNVHLWKVTK